MVKKKAGRTKKQKEHIEKNQTQLIVNEVHSNIAQGTVDKTTETSENNGGQQETFSVKRSFVSLLITYEVILAIILFFIYLYVFNAKAAYLSYFGIPPDYVQINLDELLQNSWLLVSLIEMVLFALYGLFIVYIERILSRFPIDNFWYQVGLRLILYVVFFVLACFLYYIFYTRTDLPFSLWDEDSKGHVDLNFIQSDILDSKELFCIPFIVLFSYLNSSFQPTNTSPKMSIKKALYRLGLIISVFLFFLYSYTGSIRIGYQHAANREVYPFIMEKGKPTNQMIVSTYKDHYLVVYLAKKNRSSIKSKNYVDYKFKLVKISPDGQKNETQTKEAAKGATGQKNTEDKDLEIIHLHLFNKLLPVTELPDAEQVLYFDTPYSIEPK